MEAEIIFLSVELFKSCDRKSLLIGHRITVGCKHHTYRRIVFKLKVDRIQLSIDACLHHINDVILHAWEHHLCLRITKTRIVLKHLRSVLRQHQSKENNAGKRSSLCRHRIHGCLIDVLLAELVHFLCVERARGKITHAAGVESLIAVLCALVILR